MPFFSDRTWGNEDTFGKGALDSITHQSPPEKQILSCLHKSLSALGSFPLFYQIQKKRSSSSDLNVGAHWHPLQFFEAELSFPFKRLQSLDLPCLSPEKTSLQCFPLSWEASSSAAPRAAQKMFPCCTFQSCMLTIKIQQYT